MHENSLSSVLDDLAGLAECMARNALVPTVRGLPRPSPATGSVRPCAVPVELTPEQERRRKIALSRLDQFLRTKRAMAINFAKRFFASADEREDVLQEAALKAARRADSYDPSRPFETWFFQIMTNCAIDRRRTALRSPLIMSLDDEVVERVVEDTICDAEAEAIEDMCRDEVRESVWFAMNQLETAYVDILVAAYVHEVRPYGMSDHAFHERRHIATELLRQEYLAGKGT